MSSFPSVTIGLAHIEGSGAVAEVTQLPGGSALTCEHL